MHLPHLIGVFGLGNENQVRVFRHDGIEILEPERQLVDSHHALGAHEIHAAEGVPDQEPRRILVVGMDRVLEIENDCVRLMDAGIEHELGLVAG